MALKYVACDPTTFISRVVGLPNDGNNYIIRLDSGLYDFGGGEFSNIHSSGSIRIESRDGAIFTNLINHQGWSLWLACPDIEWVGAKFEGDPYCLPVPARRCNLSLGAMSSSTTYVTDPTNISFTDFEFNGSALTLFLSGAKGGGNRTAIQLRRGKMKDNHGDGHLRVTTDPAILGIPGDGVMGDVEISEITADSTNGPDSTYWGTAVDDSTHSDGTLAIEVSRLSYDSTLLIENCHLISRIKGSLNHDMHCWRVNQIQSPDVYMLVRDVKSYGYWTEGHASGNGGGNLWLAYHHSGSPTWPVEGSRSTIDLENCLFHAEVADEVAQSPGDDPLGDPLFHLFNANSSGDYHFYDCVFEWKIPNRWSIVDIRDVSTVTDYASIWYHNSTRSGIASDSPEGTHITVRTNDRTRGWKSIHRRPSYRN